MKRILFRLTMPRNNAWDGKWSGDHKNYTITRQITEEKYKELFHKGNLRRWYYNFGDGWSACVDGRVMEKGERVKKSDGFCGYGWMVESIVYFDEIKPKSEWFK